MKRQRVDRHPRRHVRRFARRTRGSQLVELAVVLPIMLVLFASVAEFGNYFYTYATLTKAARSGARYLMSRPLDAAGQKAAQSLVAYGSPVAVCTGTPLVKGLSCTNVNISQTKNASGAPETVKVQIMNFRYQPLFNLGALTGQSFSLNIAVSPSVTMKYLLSGTSV